MPAYLPQEREKKKKKIAGISFLHRCPLPRHTATCSRPVGGKRRKKKERKKGKRNSVSKTTKRTNQERQPFSPILPFPRRQACSACHHLTDLWLWVLPLYMVDATPGRPPFFGRKGFFLLAVPSRQVLEACDMHVNHRQSHVLTIAHCLLCLASIFQLCPIILPIVQAGSSCISRCFCIICFNFSADFGGELGRLALLKYFFHDC
jgi:hypothetical protein